MVFDPERGCVRGMGHVEFSPDYKVGTSLSDRLEQLSTQAFSNKSRGIEIMAGRDSVSLELPGLSREDLSVELVGRELFICVMTGKVARFVGRTWFIVLDEKTNPECVEARMANGLLTISLPSFPEPSGRFIEIKQ